MSKPKARDHVEDGISYQVVLQNNTDFVIKRFTSSTEKELVFLISQGTYYLKDMKKKNVMEMTSQRLHHFLNNMCREFPKMLDQVEWVKGIRDRYTLVDRMMFITRDTVARDMYKNGFYLTKDKVKHYTTNFTKDIKLFRYCWDLCNETERPYEFDSLLNMAMVIKEEISYNNAVSFLDQLCHSSTQFKIRDGYRESLYPYRELLQKATEFNVNFSRLTTYLIDDWYSQGLPSINEDDLRTYYDYLGMQVSLYGNVRNKYPRHLKTDHDIMTLKNNTYKKLQEDDMVFNISQHHKAMEYTEGSPYVILLPRTSMDVVDEGVDLNHCVASYVDKILKNQSTILFLRKKEAPHQSILTIEVKSGVITMIEGYSRRKASVEERAFLHKWATLKGLVEDYT